MPGVEFTGRFVTACARCERHHASVKLAALLAEFPDLVELSLSFPDGPLITGVLAVRVGVDDKELVARFEQLAAQ